MEKATILLVLNFVIRILVTIVGTYLLGIVRQFSLQKWVKTGVYSAEQKFNEGGMGTTKKLYVIDFIKNKFRLGITSEELDNLIEACVKELNVLQEKVLTK